MEASDNHPVTAPPANQAVARTASSTVRKDIGVLMFLLAAETAVAGISPTAHGAVPATIALQPKSACTSDSSSLGDTDSVGTRRTPSPDAEELLEGSELESPVVSRATLTDPAVVSRILSFVSWRRAPTLRLVHSQWNKAINPVVQIHALPGSTVKAPFLPIPTQLEEDTTTEAALQFSHPSTWRCVHCGFWNTETRVLCGNRQCQAPSLTHVGYTRIFVGQLRRDATVPFLQWLVDRIVEAPGQLRNVENHRHNVTNRGKGCAWAYFRDDEVAQRLLAYHRRMFLDIHDGVEGVWVVPESQIQTLTKASEERGYAPQRPKSLPRNALVVEVPATGTVALEKTVPLSAAEIQRQYLAAEVPPSAVQSEDRPFVDVAPAPVPAHRSQKQTAQKATLHSVAGAGSQCATNVNVPPVTTTPRFHHNPYGVTLFADIAYDEGAEPGAADWTYHYGAYSNYQYPYQGYPYESFTPYGSDGYCGYAAPPPSYEETVGQETGSKAF